MAYPGTRFIVLADLRTGSTLLSASLNQHPDIRCYGELFHERDFDDNQPDGCDRAALAGTELIDRVFAAEAPQVIGFRAMLDHPPASRPRWRGFWEHLAAQDVRVVHLHRRDRLAQYTSLQIAATTGVFHPSPETPGIPADQRPRVRIDPDAYQAWLDERRAHELERLRVLGARPLMAVTYERLTSRWTQTMDELQRFLGAPIRALPQAKHKQETRPLAEAISNYDELSRLGVVQQPATGPDAEPG